MIKSTRYERLIFLFNFQVFQDSNPSTAGSLSADPTSSDRTCGICFDTIMAKPIPKDQLFAIFPNCTHCFCFSCIRKWRRSREFESDVSKACPECRQVSGKPNVGRNVQFEDTRSFYRPTVYRV